MTLTNTIKTGEIRYNIKDINITKYEAAKFIIRQIENEFAIKINPNEINYVYAFLISSRNDLSKDNFNELNRFEITTSDNLREFVEHLIDQMGESLNINFSDDLALKKSLLQHIQPMFNRLKYNIIIINPLVEDIKKEFANVFYKLKKIINRLQSQYLLGRLSDDEIGYLTLYFQNSLEKIGTQLDVIIVCTTGIGTSHLLKTRITNHFPVLNIKAVISFNEIENYVESDIDLILTTVKLPATTAPQLIISALLDKGDINIINQFIQNNYGSLI